MKEILKDFQRKLNAKGIAFSFSWKGFQAGFDGMCGAKAKRGDFIVGFAYMQESTDERLRLSYAPDSCGAASDQTKKYEKICKVILDVAKECGVNRAERGRSFLWPDVIIYKN